MHAFSVLSVLALALAAPCEEVHNGVTTSAAVGPVATAPADVGAKKAEGSKAQKFGVVTIHSGSKYQYQAVKLSSDGHLSLNGEQDAVLEIKDDGNLYVNGQHTDLTSGYPVTSGNTWGSLEPEIKNNELTIDGSSSFFICPDDNNNIAFGKYGKPSTCTNAVGVTLYANSQ